MFTWPPRARASDRAGEATCPPRVLVQVTAPEAAPDLGRTEWRIASALVQSDDDQSRVGLAREHGDREESGGAVEVSAELPARRRRVGGDDGGEEERELWGGRAVMRSCCATCQANAGVTRSQPATATATFAFGGYNSRLLLCRREEHTEEGKDICVLALN